MGHLCIAAVKLKEPPESACVGWPLFISDMTRTGQFSMSVNPVNST
jgi:hypothetical protein